MPLQRHLASEHVEAIADVACRLYSPYTSSWELVKTTMTSSLLDLEIADFELRFDQLLKDARRDATNRSSHGCSDCRACKRCMFCTGCTSCSRCNYCVACEDCSRCTRCERCSACHDCAFCVASERCIGSAFLFNCVDCVDSIYCFGCVGLEKKEFHILNRPYNRSTYFELVRKLQHTTSPKGASR